MSNIMMINANCELQLLKTRPPNIHQLLRHRLHLVIVRILHLQHPCDQMRLSLFQKSCGLKFTLSHLCLIGCRKAFKALNVWRKLMTLCSVDWFKFSLNMCLSLLCKPLHLSSLDINFDNSNRIAQNAGRWTSSSTIFWRCWVLRTTNLVLFLEIY